MEGNKIVNKPSRYMSILFIIALISIIISYLSIVDNQYFNIGLFAIGFFIAGISATSVLHPSLSFRELTRKFVLILAFGLVFSLLSSIIVTYFMDISLNNINIVLSIFSIILMIIFLFRDNNGNKKNSGLTTESKINENIAETVDDIENLTDDGGSYSKISSLAILILAVFTLISMTIPPFNVLHVWYFAIIPFIAFVPGYYIINTLVTRKDDLLVVERMSIAVFSSLVIMSIIGLIIVQINGKLNMRYVSIILVILSVILILVYLIKIRKVPNNERFYHRRTNIALVTFAIIAILAVVGSGIYATTENLGQGNTTFVVNGINKTADSNGYVNFTDGENVSVQLNVTNQEHKNMNYTVRVEVHNDTTNKTLTEQPVSLNNGQSWVLPYNLTMSPGQKDIQFVLYKNNKPYVIRHLYCNVTSDYSELA